MTDSKQLTTLKLLARTFDDLIRVPGTNIRFGLDSLIGLLPGGGDLVGGAVSAYAIVVAARLGAPASVIARMGLNILIDTIVGAIPVLGDMFDVAWKANRKNVALLERYLQTPLKAKRASIAVVAAVLIGVVAVTAAVAVITVLLIVRLLHR